MPLLVVLLLLPVVAIVLTPLILLQRYRLGTARRLVRPLLVRVTLGAMVLSAAFFLVSAAITAIWVPRAFTLSAAGMGAGLVFGMVGLRLTRWEATPRTLHYTPNRWLVLFVTLLVSTRMAYGLWRAWHAARAGLGDSAALAAFGVAGSMAVAAVVIGYYLAFSAGLQARLRRWQRRPLRAM